LLNKALKTEIKIFYFKHKLCGIINASIIVLYNNFTMMRRFSQIKKNDKNAKNGNTSDAKFSSLSTSKIVGP